MTSLQEQLERIYCPPLDTALVAAIASDEGQTFQSAKEVLDTLVADIEGGDDAAVGDATGAVASRSPSPSKPSSSSSSSPPSNYGDGTATPATSEDIDRMLEEFHLAEKLEDGTEGKEAQLKLTDDEEEAEEGSEEMCEDQRQRSRSVHRPFPAYDEAKSPQPAKTEGVTNPLTFLSHAFPTRTDDFLRGILTDCYDDVGATIDTLMAIDLAEREAVESVNRDVPGTSRTKKGLDYEALSSSSANGRVKGKKGRAMRKQAQQEYLRSVGQDTGPIKGPVTKVTLGDVRQGGSGSDPKGKQKRRQQDVPPSKDISHRRDLQGLSDFEIAQRLAKEEDPEAGEAVRDNQWLLTSSVLSQIATLLEIEPMTVTSTYNKSSFNLHIAIGRLIDTSASTYPTLRSLEEAGDAPKGTAESVVNSLSSLSGKSTDLTSLALRATKGRQDATLDLLNLIDVVKEATTSEIPDELDPLGKLKGELGEDAEKKQQKANLQVESNQRGISVDVQQDPLPGEASKLDVKTLHRATTKGNQFAKVAVMGHQVANSQPTGQAKALASLVNQPQSASSSAISFPPSAGTVGTTPSGNLPNATQLIFSNSGPRTIREKEDAIHYYKSLAVEYQQRRNDCLTQASSAWRTSNTRNKSAAFYYADEARRLDLKSRAFNLKASQALVEFRKSNSGEGLYSGSTSAAARPGVVDLHGVTVREALSIVQDELNAWWGLPSSSAAAKRSLTIVTGAGKHSPGQVAVLTPSVAKFLSREGWKADVDRARGVIVVRGR